VSSCTSELGASPLCLQLGQAVINCFLPFIQGGGQRCNNVDTYAQAQCAQQLDQFQQCSDSATPTPTPVPVPVPLPIPEPAANCSSAGSSTGVTCDLTSKCVDGTYYMVNCKQGSPTESFCTCQTGNGSGASAGGGFTLNESVAFACYDAVSACGGPIPGPIPLPR